MSEFEETLPADEICTLMTHFQTKKKITPTKEYIFITFLMLAGYELLLLLKFVYIWKQYNYART